MSVFIGRKIAQPDTSCLRSPIGAPFLSALVCVWPILWMGCLSQEGIGFTLPKGVQTTLGDPVTLAASYSTNYAVISVTWYKVHASETSSDKRTTVFSYVPLANIKKAYGDYIDRAQLVGMASLRIDPTRLEDEGTYSLSIMTDQLGNEEKFIRLDLFVPPKLEVGPSNPYVTTLGTTVTLTCRVRKAKPSISSLHWEKDGGRIETSGLSGKYSGGNKDKPSLTIRHVTRADSGLYSCLVEHVTRPALASIHLEVLYPASIISISNLAEVSVENHVTFQCVADGNPPPNITWSRGGRLLPSNIYSLSRDVRTSSLVLNDVNVNDSGIYTCSASNGVGKIGRRTTQLVVLVPEKRTTSATFSTVATVIGSSAAVLWLIICVSLVMFLVKRHRRQGEERKKFSSLYNIGLAGTTSPSEADEKKTNECKETPDKPNETQSPSREIATTRGTKRTDRRCAKVLYDYKPREDNELRLEIGDIVEILEGEEGTWCLGYLRGRMGLFPSNYVCFVPINEVSPTTSLYIHCISEDNGKSVKDHL
ncbi:protein amalgam-like isoform X1 [Branchiostoma floridae x Branchiostoma belcheri]